MLAVAVVLPTFCEREAIGATLAGVARALDGRNYEIIVVDDSSPDGTADAVRTIAREDARVRVIERVGRRGLSSAAIEGVLATAAPLVAVMDADGQHDPALLPRLVDRIVIGRHDLVVASRFAEGGGTDGWDAARLDGSRRAARLAERWLPSGLSDPMSGYFIVRSEAARALAPRLSGIGFKLLLDLVAAADPPLSIGEEPYRFGARAGGESKLDHVVALEFLLGLWQRKLGRIVPARFALFAVVGTLGVAVHMALLLLAFGGLRLGFEPSEVIATFGAMTFNFALNNALTYRDRRLHGARALLQGWLSFCLVCSVGALANIGVATVLYRGTDTIWTLSALAGVAVASVWNFALSSRFTWGRY